MKNIPPFDVLKNIRVFIPSKDEQIKVVSILDKKSKEIDALIFIKQKKIDGLNEYKKSGVSFNLPNNPNETGEEKKQFEPFFSEKSLMFPTMNNMANTFLRFIIRSPDKVQLLKLYG